MLFLVAIPLSKNDTGAIVHLTRAMFRYIISFKFRHPRTPSLLDFNF